MSKSSHHIVTTNDDGSYSEEQVSPEDFQAAIDRQATEISPQREGESASDWYKRTAEMTRKGEVEEKPAVGKDGHLLRDGTSWCAECETMAKISERVHADGCCTQAAYYWDRVLTNEETTVLKAAGKGVTDPFEEAE